MSDQTALYVSFVSLVRGRAGTRPALTGRTIAPGPKRWKEPSLADGD